MNGDDGVLRLWAERIRPRVSGEFDDLVERLVLRELRQHLGDGRRRILEVGCGDGWLAQALVNAGHAVVAIDAEESMIELARELHPSHLIDFRHSNILRLRGQRFDAVVSCGHSLGYQGWALLTTELEKCVSFLRPGGILLVDFRNRSSLVKDVEVSGGVYSHISIRGVRIQEQITKTRTWALQFNISTRSGQLVREYEACLPSRRFLADALRPYGALSWYGTYSGRPYVEGRSPRLIAVLTTLPKNQPRGD